MNYLPVVTLVAFFLSFAPNAQAIVSAPNGAVVNSIVMTNKSGNDVANYPFQFARPFLQGEILNFPQVVVNGIPQSTQADVKQRYPDGSVKHAVMAVMVPLIPGNGNPVVLTFQNQSTGNNTPLTQADMLNPAYNFDAQINLTNGTTKTADALQMLQDGNYKLWTSGQIAQTIELADDSINRKYDIGFDSYRPFRPRFYVTFWPVTHQVTVRFVGEEANTEEYEDLSADLTLKLGGPLAIVYTKTGLTTYAGSRWTKVFWINNSPEEKINIDHNLAYLALTKFVPNFDTSITIPESILSSDYTGWQTRNKDIYGAGLWTTAMPTVGGRPELGPTYPLWTLKWMYTGDWREKEIAFTQADLSVAWSVHMREGNPLRDLLRTDPVQAGTGFGLPISLTNHKTATFGHLDYSYTLPGDKINEVGPVTTGVYIKPDGAHQPASYSPQFMLTGDPFYLEEMQFWAAYTAGTYNSGGSSYGRGPSGVEGGINDETRGDGRVMYNRAEVVFLTPDNEPVQKNLKTYFTALTNDAIARWEGMENISDTPNFGNKMWEYGNLFTIQQYANSLPSPLHFFEQNAASGKDPTIFISGQTGAGESAWMHNIFIFGLYRAKELGFATDELLGWHASWLEGQVLTPGVSPLITGLYQTANSDASLQWFTSWAQMQASILPAYLANTLPGYFAGKLTAFGDLGDGYPEWAYGGAVAIADQAGGKQAYDWLYQNVYAKVDWSSDPRLAVLPRTAPNTQAYVPPAPVTAADLKPGVLLYSEYPGGDPSYAKTYGPNYYHIDWISRGMTSCTGDGFNTNGKTSGAVGIVVSQSTTFSISCSGPSGTFSDSESVVPGSTMLPPPPVPDTTAPTVPANLKATAVSSVEIDLAWSASTDDNSVAGYKIYRDGAQVGTSNGPSFADSDLLPDTTHSYTVAAFDAAGNLSAQSASAGATTLPPDLQAPSVPSGLSAKAVSFSEIDLSWTASTDNVAVAGYNIYRDGVKIDTTSTTSYADKNLTGATAYTYSVSAVDTSKNESAQSASVKVSMQVTEVDFNFGPTGAAAPSGYLKDDGSKYDASKGYGWNVVLGSRQRNVNPDPRLDSFVFSQAAASWTYNLPNGDYTVSLASGDASYAQGPHHVAVQGATVTNNVSTVANQFVTVTNAPVHVSNGTLTVAIGGTSGDTMLNYLVIKPAVVADTTPPSVPAALTAAPVSPSEIDLTWNAAMDNVGVAGYKLYRNGVLISTQTATSFADKDLSASTGYSYTVSAYDAAGNVSAQSASVSATTLTPPDTQAPSVPAGLKATAVSTSEIDLSWNASTDNVGVAGYMLYRNGSLVSTQAGTSFADKDLSASTSYSYTVSAYDAAGNVSAQSASVSATTLMPPDTQAPSVPAGLKATAVSTSEIDLSWNASTDNVGVAGYMLYRNGSLVSTQAGTSFADKDLSASTSYSYTVSAYDAAGNASAQSASVSATTQAVPVAKTAPIVSVPQIYGTYVYSSSQINVHWRMSSYNGIYGYKLFRNGILITTLKGASSLVYYDTGLQPSTTYTYMVAAVDATGNVLTQSTAVSVTTTAAQIPVITGIYVYSSSRLNVYWTMPSYGGISGYKLFRNGQLVVTLQGSNTLGYYDDTGLQPATEYTYTVSSIDGAGNILMTSAPVSATTAK